MWKKDDRLRFKQDCSYSKLDFVIQIALIAYLTITAFFGTITIIQWFVGLLPFLHSKFGV
jgi:hypothetical protein